MRPNSEPDSKPNGLLVNAHEPCSLSVACHNKLRAQGELLSRRLEAYCRWLGRREPAPGVFLQSEALVRWPRFLSVRAALFCLNILPLFQGWSVPELVEQIAATSCNGLSA